MSSQNGFLKNGDTSWLEGDAATIAVVNHAFDEAKLAEEHCSTPPDRGIATDETLPKNADNAPHEGAQPATDEPKRDDAGRFAHGTRPGPGNPYNRQVARLKRLLLGAVTDDDIVAIGKKMVALARDGNVAAARVLFTYILPKGVDPDRLDKHEWDTYKETENMMGEAIPLMQKPLPEPLLDLVRIIRPEISQQLMNSVQGSLRATPEQKAKLRTKTPAQSHEIYRQWGSMSPQEWDNFMAAEAAKKAKRRKP